MVFFSKVVQARAASGWVNVPLAAGIRQRLFDKDKDYYRNQFVAAFEHEYIVWQSWK